MYQLISLQVDLSSTEVTPVCACVVSQPLQIKFLFTINISVAELEIVSMSCLLVIASLVVEVHQAPCVEFDIFDLDLAKHMTVCLVAF